MEKKMLKVLALKVGQPPKVTEVEAKLESYQSLVGGYIDCVSLEKDVDLVVNDEGMYMKEPNRLLVFDKDTYGLEEDFESIIYGDCFVVGVDSEKGEFKSLSDLHIQKYREEFYHDWWTAKWFRETKKRYTQD